MTVSLTHNFVSAKANGSDNTLVQPSNWNDQHVLTLAAGNLLGRATGAGTGAVTEIPIGVDTLGHVTLPAGSATAAPFNLTSGTNLTTPAAGAVEYDGKLLYVTPQGTQRGFLEASQMYLLNSTNALNFASSTAAQSALGVGVTLSSGTVYAFQLFVPFTRTGSGSAIYYQSFGGAATLNSIAYRLMRYYSTTGYTDNNNSPAAMSLIQTASASTSMTSSATTTNYNIFEISGFVSINSGGTFIPQLSTNVTGPTLTVQSGAYMRINPIGAAGSNINIGNWA